MCNWWATWGKTWNAADLPSGSYGAIACSADGTRMIAGSFSSASNPGGLFISSDSGATWTNTGFTNQFFGVACSADGKKLAACVHGGPIYRSTDSGVSWTAMDAPLTNWYAMAGSADGNTLVAASMNLHGDVLGLVYVCHLTPAPELKLASVGQYHVLSWTLPSRKFVLQQNSDVNTSNWIDVTTSPRLNYSNLEHELTIPKPPGSTFYRLRLE